MKRLPALLALLALTACGAPTTSSPKAVADQAPATIEGTVKIVQWHCGGAALPPDQQPHGPCSTEDPFSTTFAVAAPLGNGQYKLVSYVTSDASGHYSVAVAGGTYQFVSKYAITHDPNDQDYTNLLTEPFTVQAGETLVKDLTIMTPPPPITIGVGN